MAIGGPAILFGKVMHARLFPKRNAFSYGIYYLRLPLGELSRLPIARNRFGLLSFYDIDHGACDGSSLADWAGNVLAAHGLSAAGYRIELVCMPRVLGYVFNPVSFWLCRDREGNLRAVICEVHNTFGERHCYLCARSDRQPITPGDTLEAEKVFHVSPFLPREGHYTFRFDVEGDRFGAWIDYFDREGRKQLMTSLAGNVRTMDKNTLRQAFFRYPLVTLRAIVLIHWQALKLVSKRVSIIRKPAQMESRLSTTRNLTKV